jgi:hypothetical protein
MRILEILARVEVCGGTSFTDLLRRESTRLPWGATLVVVAGQESERLFDTLLQLQKAGFAVSLILVQPVEPSPELRRRRDRLGISVSRVWSPQGLEMWT